MLVVFLVQLSVLFAGDIPDGHQGCSFKCKSIPPMEESLIQFGEQTNQVHLPSQVNLLVWNVYKGRKQEFEKELRDLSLGKDMLLIQEVSFDEAFVRLSEKWSLNFEHWHGISFLMKKSISTGVSNLAVANSLSVNHLRTTDLEPFSKSPKMMLASTYSWENNKKLLVINIHGINFKGWEGLKNQLDLTEELISRHEGPILFAGDFNTKNEERLSSADRYLSEYGLKRLEFENDPRKKKLDHLYTRGVEVFNSVLHLDNPGSDHPPITASLTQN